MPAAQPSTEDGLIRSAERAAARRDPLTVPALRPNPELRGLAAQTFSRTAGAPLVAGNDVRLLRDAAENYPAWLQAIAEARETICFECYIIHDDEAGQLFADALIARALDGVRVRVLYDWLGAVGKTGDEYWRRLRAAGVEVRCYNPPRASSPFGWLNRDHRKSIVVDGRVAFVSGLCVGQMWVGDAARGIDPWRDTGVALRGPAVADVEQAFAQVWALLGTPIPRAERTAREALAPAGDVALRVIAHVPGTTNLFRLDQLIAVLAQERLWLTDAYFAGTWQYVDALCAAAQDGVDVRLLVPDASDIPLLRPISRAGYRPLLAAGVRVFEWKGPMLHAKTAVADELWARVGSSNLNLASWVGNYELDVSVEDAGFAREMAAMYEADLENATEVVLDARDRVRRPGAPPGDALRWRRRPHVRRGGGSVGRVAAGAVRIGNAVSAAVSNKRVLDTGDATLAAGAGALLVVLGVVSAVWPAVLAWPLAALALWVGVTLLARALRLRARRRARRADVPPIEQAPSYPSRREA
ncbi:MAG TPA: phospholipase D-like domain-containing protein [Gemmatimonadaceae bacterium]|nr:phospholipase D-like domain-containing protein [Gemmatimonadaceae bacterium]